MLNSLWQGACSKPFENPDMYVSKILCLCLHANVSFLWFDLNISHPTRALEGFLRAYVGFEGRYSCINAREDHWQRVQLYVYLLNKFKLTYISWL